MRGESYKFMNILLFFRLIKLVVSTFFLFTLLTYILFKILFFREFIILFLLSFHSQKTTSFLNANILFTCFLEKSMNNLTCDICNELCSVSELKVHQKMRIHKDGFKCVICHAIVTTKYCLRRHVKLTFPSSIL